MRTINEIIIHCTATPEGRDVTVDEIDRWHKARGYDGCGYHYVVYRDGCMMPGRPLERQGAHCLGHNGRSIGVCYVGGIAADGRTPMDTRTSAQRIALQALILLLRLRFPRCSVHGHREFAAKACPCFDVKEEFG